MTFLWRGATRNVRLIGGPSNDHEWLARLGESDIWFKSFEVPPGTRLSYQLAPDVPDIPGTARARRGALSATAQVDPLNKAPWPADAPDRFSQEASVALPDAPLQPGWPPAPDASPQISRFAFDSPALGNSREITISQPQDLDPTDPDLVLLFLFDGERAQSDVQAPALLDGLTRAGRLPPVVAVMIPSIDSATRARELPGDRVFADVLADDLLPEVLARAGIRANPARTVLAGASYGGLGAARIAIQRPDAFGNALSMSGSFWWAPEGVDTDGTPWVASLIAGGEKLPLRVFLSGGLFETGRDGTAGILETSRILRDTLRLKGYETHWREYAGGHDYVIWRGALADGLIALFGK
nr:alpha/beta hydrolase-fold protein [Pseudogemmobacter hezensis]